MNQLRTELHFIKSLFAMNLSSAMEYRVSFLSQIFGMVLNNTMMLIFWFFFFERFGEVRGYGFADLGLLYGFTAVTFGLAMMTAGNIFYDLADLIAQGRLDYYLVFPRNLLIHVIFSRIHISPIGDVIFGLILITVFAPRSLAAVGLVLLAAALGAAVVIAYGVIAGSLAFFWGSARNASQQMMGSMITFALYPDTLFQGLARFLLTAAMPAIFIGAIPARLVAQPTWTGLGALALAALLFWAAAVGLFFYGLRRYESGSAINVNV